MKKNFQVSVWGIFLLFAAVVGEAPAFCGLQKFELAQGVLVQFDIPSNWQAAEQLYGIPLTIFGIMKAEETSRPAISVIVMSKDNKYSETDFRETSAMFHGTVRELGQKWVQDSKGELVRTFPEQLESNSNWPNTSAVSSSGIQYKVENKDYLERTYLVACKANLFHIKSLLRANYKTEVESEVLKTVRSLGCS